MIYRSIYEVYRLHSGYFFKSWQEHGLMVGSEAYPYLGGYLFIISLKLVGIRRYKVCFIDPGNGEINFEEQTGNESFATQKLAKARIKEIIERQP